MCKINVSESSASTASAVKYYTEYDLSSYPHFQMDPEKGPICTTDKTLTKPLQFTKYKDYVGLRYKKECLSYYHQLQHDPSSKHPVSDTNKNNAEVPCENFSTLGLFRSVYFHKGKLIAFAPPKSYNMIALQLPQYMNVTPSYFEI